VAEVPQIREAAPADTAAVREIFLNSRRETFDWILPETFTLEDYDAQTEGELQLVALLENRVVGFISWWPDGDFIHHLYCSQRRRGIGTALLQACLGRLGRPASLKCVARNVAAVSFYERHGFKRVESATGEMGEYFLMKRV
jgi:ribosomal protein S18 acetylase RimI-like enzyme